MPLAKGYVVLKGHVVAGVPAPPGTDHYSAHVVDNDLDYRIAINVRSNAPGFGKDLLFYLDDDFQHPIIPALKELPVGRTLFAANATAAQRRESGVALDFIRMNLFDRTNMKV